MSASSQTVLQTLLQEVNKLSGLSLELQDVTFGTPQLIDASVIDLNHPQRRNSRVEVTAGQTGDGLVKVTANYNRLSLNTLFGLTSTNYPFVGQSLEDYLNVFNARLKSDFTINDFLPLQLSVGKVLLQANPLSLHVFGQVEITVGAVEPTLAWIEMNMSGFGPIYAVSPEGERGSLQPKSGGGYVQPASVDGYQLFSPPDTTMQTTFRLVNADGPLPKEQQPQFNLDVSQFDQPQILDAAQVEQAMKAYEDAGIPMPDWYSPGCIFAMFHLRIDGAQDATIRVTTDQSGVAPLEVKWRVPRFKAKAHVSRMTQPAIKLAPASTPPEGEIELSWPGTAITDPYNDSMDLLPGPGLTGGVLRCVDWCQNYNTPTSTLNCKMVFEGAITECDDIPEWVGHPIVTANSTEYLIHACTLDKVPDLTSLRFNDQWFGTIRLTPDWPGLENSYWSGASKQVSFGMIQGLQFEFFPYNDLPNNNGETPI